ncbi:DUF421 domain-containing protein [Neobacillus niacini]|uniref:DUF421 domain-containing protein n=1 Tax=Neobacillus niacini TaxID=86668 RepID=UPI00398342A4
MELDWIWKAVVIIFGGTLLLRIAGRKSISQMTLAQTVIMIGIGSLLIQPVAGEDLWTTLGVGGVLVLTLVLMEYAQIKSDIIEQFITGKAKIIIEQGKINEANLRKVRLTVDQLEMNLRQQNVGKISDVEWATLEPNGTVGFILKDESQPVTKRQFQQLHQEILTIKKLLQPMISGQLSEKSPKNIQQDLFTEIENHAHESEPPKHLQ